MREVRPTMAIEVDTRRPALSNTVGGLSGPGIKPVAVKMVWEAARAVNIPVIGMGGITCGRDAVEFMLAGASAVAVGTANFTDPLASLRIVEELEQFLVTTPSRMSTALLAPSALTLDNDQ